MSTPHLPWEGDFVPPTADPDLIKQVTDSISGAVQEATQAATDVASSTVGSVAGPEVQAVVQDVGQQAVSTEKAATQVVDQVTPAGGAVVGASITATIEASVQAAVREAQTAAAQRVQSALNDALSGLGAPEVATIPKGDLTKIDAWERAGRTFLMGLLVTVLAGIVQVVGNAVSAGQVDFFTKSGWVAVGTLAVGSIVTSVLTYLFRYLKEPAGAAIDSSKTG